MMEDIGQFVSENLALCIIVGVILIIIGDEVLGVSRGLLGDDADNLPATPKAREKSEETYVDPLEETPKEGEARIEDFLQPQPRKRD